MNQPRGTEQSNVTVRHDRKASAALVLPIALLHDEGERTDRTGVRVSPGKRARYGPRDRSTAQADRAPREGRVEAGVAGGLSGNGGQVLHQPTLHSEAEPDMTQKD